MENPINSSTIIVTIYGLMVYMVSLESRQAECLIDVDTCIFNKALKVLHHNQISPGYFQGPLTVTEYVIMWQKTKNLYCNKTWDYNAVQKSYAYKTSSKCLSFLMFWNHKSKRNHKFQITISVMIKFWL